MFQGHGGNRTHLMNQGINGVLDFSASINPLGYPQKVREVIREQFDDIVHYPDIDCSGLRKYFARKIGHPDDGIIVGNGSTELFYLIPRALRPAKGIIFQPTFSEFAEALKSSRAEVLNTLLKEEDGFCLTYSESDFHDKKAEMAFFCNPNNPTGHLAEKAAILHLIRRHPHTLFVVDEAFIDFVDEPERYSVINETGTARNLVVVRSLTKFYGFPGLRIGYLVAHPELAKKLMEYKEPWSVNTFAQYAAMAAMEDTEFIAKSRALIFQEQSYLFNELSRINGLVPYKPTANYLFIKIESDGVTSFWLREQLLGFGIAIRDCSNFTGLNDKFFRVAVRTREENMRLIAALRNVTDRQ